VLECGPSMDFDAFCRAHPDLERTLRRLARDWNALSEIEDARGAMRRIRANTDSTDDASKSSPGS
jgi:hypothetical protein